MPRYPILDCIFCLIITGLFQQDPHPLLDLIVSLIGCAKKSISTVQCLDLIYSCLNRTILYLLSRPCNNITVQRAILEGLHKLTTHRWVTIVWSVLMPHRALRNIATAFHGVLTAPMCHSYVIRNDFGNKL